MKKTPAVIKPQAFLGLSVADIELLCKFIVEFGVFPLQRYRMIPIISDETVFTGALIYQCAFFVINYVFKALKCPQAEIAGITTPFFSMSA